MTKRRAFVEFAVLLTFALALVVTAGLFYAWGRTQPGGDSVRQNYLKRNKCQAEAHVVYERCMKR